LRLAIALAKKEKISQTTLLIPFEIYTGK
jgi:hypothetical protein